jgi:NAD(P)-dependent dehydrogenase (short-subunit alcohol dehydrogenase family)
MDDFEGRIAVVTGAGSGIGRELARLLSAAGCHVALCDIAGRRGDEAREICLAGAPAGTRVTSHQCDVSDERQVGAFRDAVVAAHDTDHVNLVVNNAGIGGGGSFLVDLREQWDKTFAVCWSGVYYCTRAFLPLLVASDEGHLVNISSVNGFWASWGPSQPFTAYSAAKFAVKGFTEALIVDLRIHAPHVSVSVVMPGHVATAITVNTAEVLGQRLDDTTMEHGISFVNAAHTSATDAATTILQGVRERRWRILVGSDAEALDQHVRERPEDAYEPSFLLDLQRQGFFTSL